MNKQTYQLPVVPLRGLAVLPAMIIHFDISREKSAKALEHSLVTDQILCLIMQKDLQEEIPAMEGFCRTGTVSRIRNVARLPHGILRVMVEGLRPAVLCGLEERDGYLLGTFTDPEPDTALPEIESAAYMRELKELFQMYARDNKKVSQELKNQIANINSVGKLMEQIAINLPEDAAARQSILDASDIRERFALIFTLLKKETDIMDVRLSIQQKVKDRIDKNQREYYLREQLKVISQELGDDIIVNEADQYMNRLETLEANESVLEKIRKEIRRFKSLGSNSAEASVSRTYIETLLDLPWEKMTTDDTDLKRSAAILDEDHYGLEKVKERVLEYLAVRTLTKKSDTPILCLAGPPGTGKTSIARSIARSLKKQYVRISLGGVRDEAEIRGHRRTYIGAMAGRIMAGIRTAGVRNPLILLDEIDKLGTSYNGDPSSALLEVLDSEQNCRFVDHYIDIPFNLSDVMFIATANDLNTVPRPLLDRMEVIEVSSYTENEKLHIAKEHLLKKQKEHHGLGQKQLHITDKALQDIIIGYTREAGVRQLERRIGEICRKAAREILEEGATEVRVKAGNLERYLGKKLYEISTRNEKDDIGIVRGLAWTAVGGVTLQTEVNVMPGKGDLQLTGQLGDVMKESAMAGISYIRSIAEKYGIEPSYFREHDIHIHIPEGAVPKDGPSAGITMATAIWSAITLKPVRADVAMTGEITLRGRVLPIGGLKEKLLAAKNARMKTVIIPEKNRRDLEEISDEITRTLEIVYAKTMADVLKTAVGVEII